MSTRHLVDLEMVTVTCRNEARRVVSDSRPAPPCSPTLLCVSVTDDRNPPNLQYTMRDMRATEKIQVGPVMAAVFAVR